MRRWVYKNRRMTGIKYLHLQIIVSRQIKVRICNMEVTGIVRRIDDLGRVVIPKETWRTLRIREGDPLLTSLTEHEKAHKHE